MSTHNHTLDNTAYSLLPASNPSEEDATRTPLPRRRSTLFSICPFILANEFCERLAFYGLSTNLIVYLTRVMGEESGFAAVQLNLFEGTCYLTPLLGAWLADSLWGRYFTILVFSIIYFFGMVMLTLSSALPGLTPPPDKFPSTLQSAALYISLYIVALGTGGIKPNVSAFGADQFDESDPEDRREKTSFFNWFYFSINLGSLLAVTVIVWIQENISWAVGFAVPAVCMALAVMVFVAGSGRYKHVPPSESPFSRVFKITWAAFRARRRAANSSASSLPDGNVSSSHTNITNGGNSNSNNNSNSRMVSFAPVASVLGGNGDLDEPFLLNSDGGSGRGRHNNTSDDASLPMHSYYNGSDGNDDNAAPNRLQRTQSLAWMDSAVDARGQGGVLRFTRQQVEEVKLVIRMLPIFFPTVLYWTIYVQMGSFFVVQGAHMDRTVVVPGGVGSFEIPAASLSMINTLAIVGLIPFYDKLLAPALRKAGKPLTLLRRIGWGLVVCVGAMASAAYVEWYRLKLYNEGHILCTPADFGSGSTVDSTVGSSLQRHHHHSHSGNGTSCNGSSNAAAVVAMSVWWQVPQYLLIGLSEVFTSIGQMEFFYDQAPDVMRSCSMALQLLSVCVGSYLSGAVVWATQAVTSRLDPTDEGWLPKDINKGRLDLFFWVLCGIMVVNVIHFVSVAVKYEYKAVEHVKRVAPRAARPGGPTPPTPPTPPRVRTAPMPSGPSAAHPAARRALAEAESPAPQPYGRSVTFLPQTPAMPAPFR